ncbi:IS3 family transposase [Aliidiomarina sp. Khilg15.8]
MAKIMDYIEFYNENRLLSSLNYLSPNEHQRLSSKYL